MRKSIPSLFNLLLITGLWLICSNCRSIRHDTNSKPVTHEKWNTLLKKYVREDGMVNYSGFVRDSALVNDYLESLEKAHPNDKNWSRNEQMAYWINAYNAYTIQLISRHYPLESIKDIKKGVMFVNSVWDIKFIHIQGYTYDLNNLEHNILRPVFKDARIHAALSNSAYSSPKLLNEAYTAAKIEKQLDAAMRGFVNDPTRNKIKADKVEISDIFKSYRRDFERDGGGSVWGFLNKYSKIKLTDKTDIEYLDYDWKLNEGK